jgi:hypothetical protein
VSSSTDERKGRRRRTPGRRRHDGSQPPEAPSSEVRERSVLWQHASPGSVSETEALAWGRKVATRFEVAGGEIIARAGTSVAASFDPHELDDAIDLALGVLADAREASGLEVGCGLALGELLGEQGALTGTAIDRALALAAHVQSGELALDEAAYARAQDSHLFVRGLRAGAVTGHVIDGRMPHKRACRGALRALREAPAPARDGAFEKLRALVETPGQRRVVLRSPQTFPALDWIERLGRELSPSLVLHMGRRAAGLQPLGGLQLALLRAGDAGDARLDPVQRALIVRLRQGAAVTRGEALAGLRALLAPGERGRAFIVLERAREIDTPSLTVTLELLADLACDAILFVLADDQGIPGALARAGAGEELTVEPLAQQERTRVAEAVLGLPQGSDIARRVALLGGETAPSVVEAARTLVCSGDLVLDGDAFGWRTRPRLPSLPIPVDALLTERAAGLEPSARRVLDAACVAPQALARAALVRVAMLDGVSAEAGEQGIAQLVEEGLLAAAPLAPMEHAIRSTVRNAMPPARAAELHRFVADVLQQGVPAGGAPFARALIAHHLAEGGREREAAAALLDTATAAGETGFARMAMRLAALALKLDASGENRNRARQLARTVEAGAPASSTSAPLGVLAAAPVNGGSAPTLRGGASLAEPERAEEAPEPRHSAVAVRAAIRAIVRGDVDAAESLVDTALAQGWDRAAGQRLWAIAQLKKGDVPAAVRALKQARAPSASPGERAREAITAALILLESDEPIEAVRAALDGLAGCRRAQDGAGERAALLVLSGCYRKLGREADAQRIEAAAGAG